MLKTILHNRKRGAEKLLYRVLAIILCICTLWPGFVLPASADDPEGESNIERENTYLLRIKSNSAGDDVQYFAIRYTDIEGIIRNEIIVPEIAKQETVEALDKKAMDDRLDIVLETTHYKPADNMFKGALQTGWIDDYLITTYYTLKSLEEIIVYQSYEPGAKGWGCDDISFFRVDRLYGLKMYGYYSNDTFVDFDGELLYSLVSAQDFSISNSDQIDRITVDNRGTARLKPRNMEFSTHGASYIFEMNVADLADAGIEELATLWSDTRPRIKNMSIFEMLILELTYRDFDGKLTSFKLPLISSAVAWAVENKLIDDDTSLTGLIQQGDTIAFEGYLPNFESIYECKLYYDIDADEIANISREGTLTRGQTVYYPKSTVTGFDENGNPVDPDEKYIKDAFNISSDMLTITGFKIYKTVGNAKDSIKYDGTGDDFTFKVTGVPEYFFTTSTVNGESVSAGTPKVLRMDKYSKGAVINPTVNLDGRYVVVLKTDDIEAAATKDDVQVIFTYMSKSGVEKKTNAIELRTAFHEFYGNWPGDKDDFTYYYALDSGSTAAFYLDISDVSRFTGVEFSVSTMSKDDWQLKAITIYKPLWIGRRTVKWQSLYAGGVFSDRICERDFDKSIVMRSYTAEGSDKPIYISGEDTETQKSVISFDPSSSDIEEHDINWNDIRFSMSFDDAHSDFGFTKARVTYTVDVKVAGNEYATSGDGDCGSDNLFYFQLIFENGKSGFVLANQQLTADGFRAGQIESFVIKTNNNYGEITAIRILPDDISETDTHDIFDKLNIEYINVTKKTSDGVAETWKAERVGWIEIDYRDQGAKTSIGGQIGRTTAEIARDFAITSRGMSRNLLFTVTTGSYAKDNISRTNYEYNQLEGSITATINYYDSTGALKHKNVDVIRAMYEFNGKAVVQSETNFFDNDGNEKKCAKSDPNTMLRGNSVDRFMVSIEDVKEIKSIEFKVKGSVSTVWKINNVSVYQINEEGYLMINSDNEYQRHYPEQIERITSSTDSNYQFKISNDGAEQKQIIDFKPNKIETVKDENGWTSVITREPADNNDTLNLYVHIYDDPNKTPMTDYDLRSSLIYHDKNYDRMMRLDVKALYKADKEGLFYATDLNAAGIDNISSLSLKANSAKTLKAYMDYAVVQHVRSGVIIDTYYISLGISNAENEILAYPSGGAEQLMSDEQRVSIALSSDEEKTVREVLDPEVKDIAVALRYTSINDTTGKEFQTAYKFITDIKDPETGESVYDEIYPGMVIDLTFNEPFVRDVVGLVIVSAGKITATADCATVGQYTLSGKEFKFVKQYEFAQEQKLSSAPSTLKVTTLNTACAEIELVTAESREDVTTAASGPVRMIVTYTSQNGAVTNTATFDDITKIAEGGFNSGETAKLKFMLKDVGEIRSVTLEPYDDDPQTKAVWGLGKFSMKASSDGKTKVIERSMGDALIVETQPKVINTANIVISTISTYYNSKTKENNSVGSDTKGETKVLIYSGDTVTVIPTVSGSALGFDVSASLERNGAKAKVTCFTADGSKVVFTPPENTSGEDAVYSLVISAKEAPEIFVTVEVCVESEPAVSDPPLNNGGGENNPPAENGGSGENNPPENGGSGENNPPETKK